MATRLESSRAIYQYILRLYGKSNAARGSQHPPRGPAWASGKLPTLLPVSPVPVQFTSTVAGLGRDSLIYNINGGGSSLCCLWPALSGHHIITSLNANSYPVRDLCYPDDPNIRQRWPDTTIPFPPHRGPQAQPCRRGTIVTVVATLGTFRGLRFTAEEPLTDGNIPV